MKIVTSPIDKVESPHIHTKKQQEIVDVYREKAAKISQDFFVCFNTAFAVLQSYFGEEQVGKYFGHAEQERRDCETAWRLCTYCEQIESGAIHIRDNVVRRNPETGRFDFFYHGK